MRSLRLRLILVLAAVVATAMGVVFLYVVPTLRDNLIAGRLKRIVVASEQFAGVCGAGWTDLGEFPIAGFARAERVYGLADETVEH